MIDLTYLKRRRKALGHTQAWVADRAGISRKHLSGIENGGECMLGVYVRLCVVLGLAVIQLPVEHLP